MLPVCMYSMACGGELAQGSQDRLQRYTPGAWNSDSKQLKPTRACVHTHTHFATGVTYTITRMHFELTTQPHDGVVRCSAVWCGALLVFFVLVGVGITKGDAFYRTTPHHTAPHLCAQMGAQLSARPQPTLGRTRSGTSSPTGCAICPP